MAIKGEEISRILKERISNFSTQQEVSDDPAFRHFQCASRDVGSVSHPQFLFWITLVFYGRWTNRLHLASKMII